MSIKITQSFSFDSRLPNFERDIIDSSQFIGQGPLNLDDADRTMLAAKYDIGHIVWDTATSKHYGVGTLTNGQYTLYEIKLSDTTLSGIAYCETQADIAAKTAVMPGFALAAGQRIIMKLSVSSTAADATLNVNSTGAKTVKINGQNTTATNFTAGYWMCEYVVDSTNNTSYWNLSRFSAQVQADWEESDSSEMSFIQNMPGVFREPWNNIDGFVVNVPDGTVIENVVQDIDGNWYNGVVIDNRIWLKENLRVTNSPSGTPITYFHANGDSSNDLVFGLLYNWNAMLSGDSPSEDATDMVQGISPDGWHIPNLDEFENLRQYLVSKQEFSPIGKAMSSKEWWDVSTVDGTPGKNPENNNATNLSFVPAGYKANDTYQSFGKKSRVWSSSEAPTNQNYGVGITLNYDDTSYIQDYTFVKNFCFSVRCVCNEPASDWLIENESRLYLKLTPTGMVWKQLSAIAESGDYNDLTNIPEIQEQVQADWDASDSDDPSYILNKPDLATVATSGDYNDLENKPVIPVIPNHRTVNHEQMTESGGFDGNVNIHDGYYFPNSVQDNDGNWYGAVVIGDQVWMAENLRTTTYTDGVVLDKSVDLSDQYAYFYPIDENHPEKGNFYNWYGAMYGQPSSGATPSGVQGVSPAGWHIPSDEEFKLLVEYLRRQRRYVFNGDNDATAKSIASTTGWTHQQNTLPGWPSVDMEDNNATGFNAIPTGYILDSILIQLNTTRFWSSNCNENDDVFCAAIDGEDDGIITGYFTNKMALCAVRCLSDLNPVQFRDWYVNTYGTMQHHLANVQVQSNWNETNTSSPSYIINKPTIPAAQIQADWNQTDTSALDYIKNKPTISAALYEEIHYDDLVDLMSNNSLVSGKMYRITDYETTTVQTDTTAAGHDFDIVVTAVSNNQLDPRASAVMRDGDSYFYTAKSDLSKWLLLYDIKNDTTKYAWADDENGKGVVYRMIDEFGNDCPYDFKNILFTKSPDYSAVYTFNCTNNGNNFDFSIHGSNCHDNTIKPYVSSNSGYRLQTLNFNVFLHTSYNNLCFNNYLDNGCYDNSFGNRTNYVVFGRNCVGNTVSGWCQGIRFGDSCGYNTIDTGCTVVEFGLGCYNNTLSMYCNNIDFGLSCHDNIINCSFCNNIRFENYNNFVKISNSETASDSNRLQNIYVVQGFNDTNGPNYVDINTITRNRSYRTTIGLQTDGTVKIYNEEDPVTASSINSPLHIGPYNYDGSQEVTIGLYDGDDSDDYSVY